MDAERISRGAERHALPSLMSSLHYVVYPPEVRPPQGAMSVRRTAAMPRTAAAAASQGGKSSRFPLGSRLP